MRSWGKRASGVTRANRDPSRRKERLLGMTKLWGQCLEAKTLFVRHIRHYHNHIRFSVWGNFTCPLEIHFATVSLETQR